MFNDNNDKLYYRKTLEREEYYSRETGDQDPDSDSDTPALETASCVCEICFIFLFPKTHAC
jgi:hypothetical protein